MSRDARHTRTGTAQLNEWTAVHTGHPAQQRVARLNAPADPKRTRADHDRIRVESAPRPSAPTQA